MNKNVCLFFLMAFIFYSCSVLKPAIKDDGKLEVIFIQLNDVYEIAPLEAGRSGGLARVAYLKKKLAAVNSNTYLVIAGDFLSPSVYNSLQFEGKRIRGRQMVETLNAAKLDLAVFGNHEFDISEQELQNRLNESAFQWVSSNSFHKKDNIVKPFVINGSVNTPIPQTYFLKVKDADGTEAKIGFIAINIPFNKAPYVSYTDPTQTAVALYNKIKDSCDLVIAITHQQIKTDMELAKALPGLALIIGGHEHDNRFHKEGNVLISKADANAKTVYIHKINIHKKTKSFLISSELKAINDSMPADPSADSIVNKWMLIAEKSYQALGFNANNIIRNSGEPLEGREGEIRNRPTNLTRIIVSAMEAAAPLSDLAILNAGSIRVDDVIQMPVSEYDILRSLPFGGGLLEVEMKGSLLLKILQAGTKNKGNGGFLHYSSPVVYDSISKIWNYKASPIDNNKIYRVALTDFLLTGGEANMEFLKKDHLEIIKIYNPENKITDLRSDIRLAVIKYMSNLENK